MTTWAVLATGPSMSRAVADQVKGRCRTVTVSDAWTLAPWADALVSTDGAWWKAHPEALEFKGRKFGAMQSFRPLESVESFPAETHTNSGLLGLMVAVHLGAKRVLLCGVDLNRPGHHFFGRHPAPLKSTSADRMAAFKRQFGHYRPRGIEIVNCSPSSSLDCYPRGSLEDCLAESAVLAD